jgi:hypothetical protein
MNERKTKTSLQLFLFFSLTMTLITAIQIFVNVLQDRPYWLVVLLFLPIPLFVFTAIMISLDLAKQDYLTLQGRLKNKSGNKITIKSIVGNDMKFRINNDQIKDIRENKEIELEYYKRTKAVISIKIINKKQENFEG